MTFRTLPATVFIGSIVNATVMTFIPDGPARVIIVIIILAACCALCYVAGGQDFARGLRQHVENITTER